MDPLSIAGSIAGLITLAAGVIQVVDGLFKDLKSTPEVLILISQQTTSLRTVLDKFDPEKAGASVADREGIALAVSGCKYVLERIGKVATELRLTQGKRSIQKSFMSVTVSSKLKELAALEDRLERFKSTMELLLIVELHEIRQVNVSAQDLKKNIEELQRLVGRNGVTPYATTAGPEAGRITRPSFSDWLAQWEEEADIDDDTVTEDEEIRRISQLRKEDASQRSSAALVSGIRRLPESITFSPNNDFDFGSKLLAVIPEVTRRVKAVKEGDVHLIITDLKRQGSDNTYIEEIHTTAATEQYKVIQQLCNKGYVNVCGFRDMGSQTIFSPILPHEAMLAVTVTDGPSCYDIRCGLKINANERLVDFYNKFITDELPKEDGPLSAIRNAYDVTIRDERRMRLEELRIEFKRTLRVPENGEQYSNPAYFGSFPLYSAQAMHGRLPPAMQKKGGVFFPMLQREALAMSFAVLNQQVASDERYAVRVFAGSVNCITGLPQSQTQESLQDYIVVPKTKRLNGFRIGPGVAAQFVAMPLGFDYSVEKQVTGREYIGGIQLQIAPCLSTSVNFYRSAYNPIGYRFRLKGVGDGLDLFQTPEELGFSSGERILMEEIISTEHRPRTKRMYFRQDYLIPFGDMNLQKSGNFPFDANVCRPTFVHELFTQPFDETRPMNRSLILQPVEPLELSIDWPAFGVRRHMSTERYSPFMHMPDLKKTLQYTASQMDPNGTRDGSFLVNGTRYYQIEGYAPLMDNSLDGAVISLGEWVRPTYTDGIHMGYDPKSPLAPPSTPPVSYPTSKAVSWEMAIGAGGSLTQNIDKSSNPLIWDWKQSCFLNIQIINAIAFQEMTGILPISPLSFSDYRKAGIPFYGVADSEEEADISETSFTALTISEIDSSTSLRIGTRLKPDGSPTACALCEVNLCNNLLLPCLHIFCSDCVKSRMTKAVEEIECFCCEARCVKVVTYGAPMELPVVNREKTTEAAEDADGVTQTSVQDLLHLFADQFLENDRYYTSEGSVWTSTGCVKDGTDRLFTADMILSTLMRTDLSTRLKALDDFVTAAHKFDDKILRRVLALVPNVDDVKHTAPLAKLFVIYSNEECFITLFRWITKGTRSFSQLGINLSILVNYALSTRSDACMSLIAEEAKRRNISPSAAGISAHRAQKSSSWDRHALSLLLRHGADPNEVDSNGLTCLHKADDAPSITEKLLEAGAKVEILDPQGRTAIHLAVERRWTSRLRPLLESDSGRKCIHMKDDRGRTALDIAAGLSGPRMKEIIEMLLDVVRDVGSQGDARI